MDITPASIANLFFKYMLVASLLSLTLVNLTISAGEVPATEIVAKIKDQTPIEYDNITVSGGIDLKSLSIESPIKITNSSISRVDLSRSTFARPINFAGSVFEDDIDFSNTKFQDFVGFENATFEKNASFMGAEFSETNFLNTNFKSISDFNYTKFNDYCNFAKSKFQKALFSEAVFAKACDFSESVFVEKAQFPKTYYDNIANFRNTKFKQGADFSTGSKFNEVSAFTSSEFGGDANFKMAKFKLTHFGSANFSNDARFDLAQFENIAYFIGSTFRGNLNLTGSKIANIKLERTNFTKNSEIDLKDADFVIFGTHWNHVKDYLKYDGAAYLKLVKNYKDLEWFSDSDDCYYQYRSESQKLKPWGPPKILDILSSIACGYGVRPERPVVCSLILIAACTTILFTGKGLRNPTSRDKMVSMYDNLYYCLAVFFTIPLPDLKTTGRYRYVPVVLRAISWTLFALLIATLGKVMIR